MAKITKEYSKIQMQRWIIVRGRGRGRVRVRNAA